MHVISRKTIKDFWDRHSDAEQPLRAWFTETTSATWHGPADIKNRYPTASFLTDNRVVFNIKGNRYRLVVHVRYDLGRVYIRFAGTHAEYDKINAVTV